MSNLLPYVYIYIDRVLQYTYNILDLLVTIGHNIQSTIAYRSTGMELRVFSTQVQRDNRIKQRSSFCFVCLFDLILCVPSTILQLNRDGPPGLNQY